MQQHPLIWLFTWFYIGIHIDVLLLRLVVIGIEVAIRGVTILVVSHMMAVPDVLAVQWTFVITGFAIYIAHVSATLSIRHAAPAHASRATVAKPADQEPVALARIWHDRRGPLMVGVLMVDAKVVEAVYQGFCICWCIVCIQVPLSWLQLQTLLFWIDTYWLYFSIGDYEGIIYFSLFFSIIVWDTVSINTYWFVIPNRNYVGITSLIQFLHFFQLLYEILVR